MKKVAHVFKSLAAGGIEKWLTDIAIENEQKKIFELHFLLQSLDVGFFENQVPSNSVIIKKWDMRVGHFKYFFDLYKHLRKENYDVVHSHVHHFSGIILFVAFLAKVKIRVAHSHNDKREVYKGVSLSKKIYFLISKILLILFSNRKISVSDKAAKSLFPVSQVKVLPCGLRLNVNSSETYIKKETNEIVVGHVGSFSKQKNHLFICKVAQYLEEFFPGKYKFHLVGSGELYSDIVQIVSEMGLEKTIIFLGLRHDVKELILTDFDVVILPSLYEGLAMVALETQYYGKPIIISDNLSTQHTLSSYISYAPISDVSVFAGAIQNFLAPSSNEVYKCRARLDSSVLSVSRNMTELDLY
jgi:glycosyltransferase EpsF